VLSRKPVRSAHSRIVNNLLIVVHHPINQEIVLQVGIIADGKRLGNLVPNFLCRWQEFRVGIDLLR
jgi:hypothetical protein